MRNLLLLIGLTLSFCFSALAQNVNDYKVYQEKGRQQLIENDYKSALNSFDKALSIMKYSSSMFYERGYVKMELEDYEGALVDFSEVVRLAPHKYQAYINRAKIHLQLDQPELAKQDAEKALSLDSENRAALDLKQDADEALLLIQAKELEKLREIKAQEEARRHTERRDSSREYLGIVIPLIFWSTIFLTW